MFTTPADILAALQDTLQRNTLGPAGGSGPNLPFWTSIATRANTRAYNAIVGALMGRGYSKTLIDQWDRGAEFQTDIAVWWCLATGASQDTNSYDMEALRAEAKMLDRRWELTNSDQGDGVLFTIGGVFKDPDTRLGQPFTGHYNTTEDFFGVDNDFDDVRRGEETVL